MTPRNEHIARSNLRSLTSILGMSICLLVIVTLDARHTLWSAQLSDVSQNSYEGQAALYLQKRGVISGFPDGTFRGSQAVNRVEAAKMLLLAGNYTLRRLPNNSVYPDVQPGTWYEQFALNAVDRGLMDGYPDGTFGPSRPVQRAEFLKMLANTFQVETGLPYHYTDVPSDAWYSPYAGTAEKYNLFLYDTNTLVPSATMTRQEVAWAIYQMFIFRSYDFVIRTPFDYTATGEPTVPIAGLTNTLHGAAGSSSSSQSSVGITSSTVSSAPSSTAGNTPVTCADSDATAAYPTGFNVNEQGTATNLLMSGPDNSFTDSCRPNSNILFEYYCNDSGYLTGEEVNCTINCTDGACSNEVRTDPDADSSSSAASSAPTSSDAFSSNLSYYRMSQSSSSSSSQTVGCTDTDATARFTKGHNVYERGITKGPYSGTGALYISENDTCVNEDTVREFSCGADNNIVSKEVLCELGCADDACISPGDTGSCSDQDVNDAYPDGKNDTVKSRIFVMHPEEGNYTNEDYCVSPGLLNEFICASQGRVGRHEMSCTCRDGVCVD